MAYLLRLFFGLSGKINRSEFWLASLGLFITARIGLNHFEKSEGILVLIIIASIWSGVAIQVKRWHDRDKSGAWILIHIIPIVGQLWTLIELGFVSGKSGSEDQKLTPEEAERAQKEHARRRAYAAEKRADEKQYSSPPLPEDIRFARALGLSGQISKDDVKQKYRKLAHKYHPDKVSHLGNEFKELANKKFTEINEAYKYFSEKYGIS